MKKQFIRAEDFEIAGDRIILGGRRLLGDSVLFAHVEKRVSAELLGCVAAGLALAAFLPVSRASTGMPILVLVIGLLGLGAFREIRRPYTLVMEIYQIGIFEVRGFTAEEAAATAEVLDELRSGTHGSSGQRQGSIPGTSGC